MQKKRKINSVLLAALVDGFDFLLEGFCQELQNLQLENQVLRTRLEAKGLSTEIIPTKRKLFNKVGLCVVCNNRFEYSSAGRSYIRKLCDEHLVTHRRKNLKKELLNV